MTSGVNWNYCSFSIRCGAKMTAAANYVADKAPCDRHITYGVVKSLLTPVELIIECVEGIFKGLTNLLGFPFSDRLYATTGVKLIGISVASLIAAAVFGTIGLPYSIYNNWYASKHPFNLISDE